MIFKNPTIYLDFRLLKCRGLFNFYVTSLNKITNANNYNKKTPESQNKNLFLAHKKSNTDVIGLADGCVILQGRPSLNDDLGIQF